MELVVVFIVTVGVCFLIAKKRMQFLRQEIELTASAEINRLQERLLAKEEQLEELKRSSELLTNELKDILRLKADLQAQVQEVQARREEEIRAKEEQIVLLQNIKGNLQDSFKALSAEALSSNNQSFLELAKQNLTVFQEGTKQELEKKEQAINQMLKPFVESLAKVDQKITNLEKVEISAKESLKEQISLLFQSHKNLQSETSNLVKALRAPQTRGRWGELQLKRVVELAGMIEYCDFIQQDSTELESGARLRPDMIVRLPNNRSIVVDAKVPLKSYIESTETDNEEEQQLKLMDHARQVRNHLSQLGSKSYWQQYQPGPDFVILFLPGEPYYHAAVKYDPELFEAGVNSKVLIATPMNLIALLKVVAYGWRQESLERNAKEISKLGADLYERLTKFVDHYVDLKRSLERAVEAYNKSVGTLESRVLVTARKFKELEVSGSEIEVLEQIDKIPRVLQIESESISSPEPITISTKEETQDGIKTQLDT